MWELKNNQLIRAYQFNSFEDAIDFINRIAAICSKENHHPKIVNTYTCLILTFCTHDAGNTVTELDYKVTKLIDALEI